MSNGKYDAMRNWIFGAVATGMIFPSMPAFGQSKSSIFVNPKNSARKPVQVQTTEPPRLLAVPDGDNSTSLSNQAASQIIPTAGEKSEVQKQLDAMYEQDGREAPTFNLQPLSPLNAKPQQNAQAQQTNPAPTTPQPRPGQSNPSATPKPVRSAQGYTQYQPRMQATPYPSQPATTAPRNFSAAIDAQSQPQAPSQTPPQYLPQYQQPHKNPISSLFRRITGANKYAGSQAPMPPDAHDSSAAAPQIAVSPSVPAVPIAAKYSVSPRSTVQPVRPMTAPILATTPLPIQNSGQVQIMAGTNSVPSELPPPLIAMPALAEAPMPLGRSPEQTSLPPLMTEPQSTTPSLKSLPEAAKTGAPAAELAAEFPNPFPEVTETEADGKIAKSPKSSGIALDAPGAVNDTKGVELNSPPETATKTEEDPFAVKAKDFSEPSIDEKLAPGALTVVPPSTQSQAPQLAPPPLETPNSELPQLESPPASATTPEISMPQPFDPPSKDNANPSSELMPPGTSQVTPPPSTPGAISPPDSAVDPQIEKMRRIRERFGMKGLKGFCPVTLHDERELVDARPEFHFTHRSQKFHFATAEAREKFEANPSKYAPAAYGADVVALCRDKDVVEGTLDFAAWFKGRLYLFGTQANYEVFISAPTKYASLAEIE